MRDRQQGPLLSLRGVTRTFESETSGVRAIDLDVSEGEFVAIVGPSGAGKSTLLNLLGLLDRPTSGTYLFDGVDVGSLKENQRNQIRARRIGFVFQSSFVLGDEDTITNAALGLRINGSRLAERHALAHRALELLGIEDRANTRAKLLSVGERQRLALARAIATQPTLLLADEPTGNLDTRNTRGVIDHLLELNSRGTTVVIVTHDSDIAKLATRRIEIVDGHSRELPREQLALHGRPRLNSGSKTSYTPGGGVFPRIADLLADAISAIGRRLARSALLVLAFALGIAGLVMAIGTTESASNQVSQRLSAAALDEVRVNLPGGSQLLHPEDVRLAQWMDAISQLPHVESVGYVATVGAASAEIRRLGLNDPPPLQEYFLMTASATFLEDAGVTNAYPPNLELVDADLGNVAWVGELVTSELRIATPGPGSSLWIAGRRLDVVGQFESGSRSPNLARAIVVSKDVIAKIPGASVSLIVRTEPAFPAALAEAIPLALSPNNPGQFIVETVADLRDLRFGISNDLSAFVAALAAILLGLATISASTTMYLSVQARTQEIALRRAIGSSRFSIAQLFLVEGCIIGFSGGILGSFVGTVAAIVVAMLQGWAPVLPQYFFVLAPAIGTVTGLLSGIPPALSASRKDPATAIR